MVDNPYIYCRTFADCADIRDFAQTLNMLRRWWRVRADLAGTLSTPAERLRATDLLQAFLSGP
jgi:hypothetical protein